MSLSTLLQALDWLVLSGAFLTAIKLLRTGLHRQYRVLFAYFIFRTFEGIYPLFMNVSSRYYFWLWIATAPIVWTFYILIALELYRKVMMPYRGLYTLGRWLMAVNIAVSVFLSALALMPRLTKATPVRSKLMGYVTAADRGVELSVAIFLLLMILCLSRYPVQLSRNVIVNTLVFATYFLANSIGMLLHSLFGLKLGPEINVTLQAVSVGCMAVWLFYVNARGEEVQVQAYRIRPEHEERILIRLDSLNKTLLEGALLR